jgi:glycosidase
MKNVLYVLLAVVFFACTSQSTEQAEATKTTVQRTVETVEWAEDAIIYEVNIRQFTPEGTFTAFKPHIARLKDLGVDILWIMPIHPIGEKNRKGTLGSYYSVKNYKGVNPDFGTLDDFKTLVEEAHLNGMYVIIDWVANHTAWDHDWINENPDWYAKDSLGNMYYPADWTDVCQLNYDNEELHEGMIDALEYWVEEADIDGYRCDVAGMVPTKFWNKARIALDEIKPVFMLAEDEHTYDLMNSAFDMNYAWHMHHIMNQIAKGEESVKELVHYYERYDTIFPKSVYRMNFITNHDENSWNGTVFERLGDGVKTFAVMSYTIPGMPLIYTGQEAGNSKRLEFFEKDEVDWSNEEYVPFTSH